jgi:glucokinase
MTREKILVADIGGSHITVGSFQESPTGYGFEGLERNEIDSTESKNCLLQAWSDCLGRFFTASGSVKIGVAFPAPFDYKEGICLNRSTGKIREPLQDKSKKSPCREAGDQMISD